MSEKIYITIKATNFLNYITDAYRQRFLQKNQTKRNRTRRIVLRKIFGSSLMNITIPLTSNSDKLKKCPGFTLLKVH